MVCIRNLVADPTKATGCIVDDRLYRGRKKHGGRLFPTLSTSPESACIKVALLQLALAKCLRAATREAGYRYLRGIIHRRVSVGEILPVPGRGMWEDTGSALQKADGVVV